MNDNNNKQQQSLWHGIDSGQSMWLLPNSYYFIMCTRIPIPSTVRVCACLELIN